MSDLLFNAQESLTGLSGRRAVSALHAIEQRTAYILSQSRHLLDVFLHREVQAAETGTENLFQRWEYSRHAVTPTLDDFERYAPQWRELVTANLPLRAQLVHAFAQKYPFNPVYFPNIRAAFVLDDRQLAEQHEKLFQKPLSSIFITEAPTNSAVRSTMDGFFSVEMLRAIENEIEWVDLPRGATLYTEGEPSDALHVLIHGRLMVTVRNEHGVEQPIRTVGRGEMLGETALLAGGVRTATCRANRDSMLMKLPKTAFDKLSDAYPRPMLEFYRTLASRIRATKPDRGAERRISTIALLPVSYPVLEFAEQLSEALATYGGTLVLNAARIVQQFGTDAFDTTNSNMFVAWLNEQEAAYRFILYMVDVDNEAWTDRCLRQADRVLLIADAADSPALSAVEARLDAQKNEAWRSAPKELVLIHPSGQNNYRNTAAWLGSRQTLRHYHVESGNKSDFQRIARTLAGFSFGLVFGGGGARGFAHVGVMKAIREFGLPIDRVGGTSAGAIAAAIIALRSDEQTLREWTKLLFASFNDPTLPILSVMKGEKFTRTLQKLFGEIQIEDLPLDYFAIATNLTRARMMVLRRGHLWRALRASASLPGIFPPVLENNELLIDGAIFDNVPITTMQEFCEGGSVIAVNVEDMVVRKRNYQFSESQSGWALLGSRILPWMKGRYKAPSLIGIISRATVLSSIDQLNATKDRAEIYLNPPVSKYGTFDVKSAEQMIEIGYQHTRERLEEWQKAQAAKNSTA